MKARFFPAIFCYISASLGRECPKRVNIEHISNRYNQFFIPSWHSLCFNHGLHIPRNFGFSPLCDSRFSPGWGIN